MTIARVHALFFDVNKEWHRRASLLVMMASGFAGLGYQIVWTQQCALWLGHEAAGVLAVVTAFFGGLAVGAFCFGPRIERSARPLRWYVACECVIAAWSFVLALLMASASALLLDFTGAQPSPLWQWTVAFCGTFLLLLPATAAMGATLPALERVTAGLYQPLHHQSRTIAALYASNTLGAVIGVLACAFWLVPELGLIRSAIVCSVLNFVCAAAALLFLAPRTPQTFSKPSANIDARSFVMDHAADRAVLWQLALTGFLGIGYEVLVVRVLSQVEEDTVYTFAMLLAVYLIGSAVGAAIYQRWLTNKNTDEQRCDRLLCALAAACLAGTASLWADEIIKAAMLRIFGGSMTAALAAEALLAVIAFGPPTLVMGALFSHLAERAVAAGHSFGHALGINTLGAAVAPLLCGVFAFPLLGPKLSLLFICCGYLALAGKRQRRNPMLWLPLGAALVLLALTPPLAFIEIPEGGRVVSYQEGVMAAVSVVEDADGVARLRIDNRQQEGSSATRRVDGRQALLPVLLHPAPARVLFLGLGTGVTASVAAADPGLQVDAVELLPEVIAASRFFSAPANSTNKDNTDTTRLHLIAADARRYVRTSTRQYDVIIADNFHPARSGSGSLYTVEHFAAVRARLASRGIFCQWLPLHQLDLDTLRSVVRSFVAVYPHGWAMIASNSLETPVIGLVARSDDSRLDIAALRQHLARDAQAPALGIEDEFALLGEFIAGPQALRHFAGDAPINTDDHPVVAYRAPRITYAPDSLPRDRLIALLHQVSIAPDELFVADNGPETARRIAAYWLARDRFIESGRAVRPVTDVRAMLAQVRDALLAVLRISPDFRPAYDPLLMMATNLAQTDTPAAADLLAELIHAQPARTEAALALHRIDVMSR